MFTKAWGRTLETAKKVHFPPLKEKDRSVKPKHTDPIFPNSIFKIKNYQKFEGKDAVEQSSSKILFKIQRKTYLKIMSNL